MVFITISSNAYAADVLHRMLNADEVKEFKEDQDALIIGYLIKNKDKKFSVKVLKVLSGEVNNNIIYVKNNFKYSSLLEGKPNVKDYCFLSLKKYGDYYKVAYDAIKADSGDYRTLKLVYDLYPSEISAIEWYINSGGKEKDFYFNGNQSYVRTASGKEIEITKESLNQKKIDSKKTMKNTYEVDTKSNDKLVYLLIGGILICALIIGFIFKYKSKNIFGI